MGARLPHSANQGTGRAGSRGQPARDGPVSHSTVCDPKRMGAAWRGCRTKATDEATSPHPVIVGSGHLEDRASAPFSKWAAPPRLPPFMGKARTAPLLRRDTCMQSSTPSMLPTSHTPPHAAPRAGSMGSTAHEETYRGKNHPACPRTVLGPSLTTRLRLRVAQARGILSVYKKRGTLFVPL